MATYPDCCKCSASLCICKSSFSSLKESNLQAADRFMRLMEKKGPTSPQHLVVFITSAEDFSEQIAQLQSRNFQVAVLYHYASASKKVAAIGQAANISYDWLPFLTSGLNNPHLTLTYDPNGGSSCSRPKVWTAASSPSAAQHMGSRSCFKQLLCGSLWPTRRRTTHCQKSCPSLGTARWSTGCRQCKSYSFAQLNRLLCSVGLQQSC